MLFICHFCHKEVIKPSSPDVVILPEQSCPNCGRALHSCVSCVFFSEEALSQCLKEDAERVLLKEEVNSCEYFVFKAFSLLRYLKEKRKMV